MNESYWILSTESKQYEKLNENLKVDTLIIGAGIVGVTTAYLLAKQGINSVIIDADKVGYGTTGRNTGKVTTQHGTIFSKINNKYGLDTAKLYYEGNQEALDLVKNIIEENNIDCNFEDIASFIFTENENYIEELKDEYEVCKNIGIDCNYHDELNLPIDVKGAISFVHQGQFNPKKYIDKLMEINAKLGVKLYENTEIVDLEPGKTVNLKTKDNHKIEANRVVLASHFPWYDGLNLYFAKEKAERSYLIAANLEKEFPKGNFISVEEPTKILEVMNGKDINY